MILEIQFNVGIFVSAQQEGLRIQHAVCVTGKLAQATGDVVFHHPKSCAN